MKKYQGILGLGLTALSLSMAAGQVPFTAGNLVVLQAGEDGAPTALSSAAAKLFLKEIDVSTGAVVQTIPVPFTATASGNRAVTQSGSATSEGFLHLSTDGKSLVFVGYNADAGTLTVATTLSATTSRVIASVNCGGVIDSTTALGDAYSGGNIRAAASTNGTEFWTSGNGGTTAPGPAQSGVRYATLGGTTTVALQDNGGGTLNTPLNTRVANIFFGQLYASSSSTSFQGVITVGTGLPTTTGQFPASLNGFPMVTGFESAYDYYFADANTLYVADDATGANATPGLQKWTQSAGTWTRQYSITAGLPSNAIRCLTGKTNAGVTTIWATTAGGTAGANSIMSLTDTGAASTFSTALATSGANTWWRGIAFAPTGCGSVACYANCDLSTSAPILNANDFQCFLNEFAASTSYANCDLSTSPPVLNANDFQCFLNAFASGCT